MTERFRTLCHLFLGVVLASAGLAWAFHEGGENATNSLHFAEQAEEADTEGRAGTPGSRLARIAATAPRLVTVTVDGSTRKVATEASTVGDVLAAAGVDTGRDDRVSPPRDTPVEAGMTVEVARVKVEERTRTETVGFDTVERPSDGLAEGKRQEEQAGQEGVVEILEEVVLVDGEVEERTRVGARVQREPADRVVLVGTADPQGDGGSSASDQEPALASRQSADPPDPPDPPDPSPSPSSAAQEAPEPAPSGSAQPSSPEPAPSEPPAQESSGNTQEGEASRYADHFTGDATASGEPYDPNALTAAHKSLPLGTVVTVTNTATGASVRVRINDRGPYAAGRIIDLSRAAWNRIAPPSAGTANVRLEW